VPSGGCLLQLEGCVRRPPAPPTVPWQVAGAGARHGRQPALPARAGVARLRVEGDGTDLDLGDSARTRHSPWHSLAHGGRPSFQVPVAFAASPGSPPNRRGRRAASRRWPARARLPGTRLNGSRVGVSPTTWKGREVALALNIVGDEELANGPADSQAPLHARSDSTRLAMPCSEQLADRTGGEWPDHGYLQQPASVRHS